MVFGLSSDKCSDTHTDEIKELKNQVKLVELDLEKRMILLESSISSIQKVMGSLEKFESSRSAIADIQETKNTLREIEDVGYISKLETISNSDKISAISDTVDEMNEKIKLISDAVEILGESKSAGKNSPSGNRDNSSLNSEISALNNAVSKISSSISDPKKISEIDKRINTLEKTNNAINAELKKIYDLYHEKINFLEKRISSVSAGSGIRGADPEDIAKMKEEMEHIKNNNAKLAEIVESNIKNSNIQKNTKTGKSEHNDLNSVVADLSIKVAAIKKEMSLDRAMYPRDIMAIKKDMKDVKTVQKNLTDIVDSIAKRSAMRDETPDYGGKIKNIEKSINDISGKISEIATLNGKMIAINAEINSLKSNKNKSAESETNYKRLAEMAEQNSSEFNELKGLKREYAEHQNIASKVSDISAKVAEIKTEMGIERTEYSKDIPSIRKDVMDMKAVQNSLADIVESLVKTKKEINGAPDYGDKIKNIEKSAALIDAGNKKMQLFEKSLNELAEKISGLQKLKDDLPGIINQVNLIREKTNRAQDPELRAMESLENEKMLSNRIKSLTEENMRLWQEMEQLKQLCAEIINSDRQQPIIIE